MNQKGFTLMEVLGVIMLLAVIAIITMPTILGVIDDSKLNAFTRSVDEMQNVVVMDYNEYARSGDIIYTFEDNNLMCTGCDDGSDLILDFNGDVEGEGNIIVNSGEVISLNIESDSFKAILKDGKLETSKK